MKSHVSKRGMRSLADLEGASFLEDRVDASQELARGGHGRGLVGFARGELALQVVVPGGGAPVVGVRGQI